MSQHKVSQHPNVKESIKVNQYLRLLLLHLYVTTKLSMLFLYGKYHCAPYQVGPNEVTRSYSFGVSVETMAAASETSRRITKFYKNAQLQK